MPYIEKERRAIYDRPLLDIITSFNALRMIDVAGDFTYIVFVLLRTFSGKFWMRALGIGCLICAILEMYRKEHALYENEKELQNGSIEVIKRV